MNIFHSDEEATFLKRPNRFIIHASLRGKEVICHCPNTGRMGELLLPGVRLILEKSRNVKRKTAYSVVGVYKGDLIVPITSARANNVAKEIIIPKLFKKPEIKSEVTFGKSRFDFLVRSGDESTFIEVKSCTLFMGDDAIFPDAPTSRGTKHLNELELAVEQGYKGMVVFVVFNPYSKRFMPNSITDPLFAETLKSLSNKIDIIPFTVGVQSSGEVYYTGDSIIPINFS